MPKITRAGGPSIEGVTDVQLEDGQPNGDTSLRDGEESRRGVDENDGQAPERQGVDGEQASGVANLRGDSTDPNAAPEEGQVGDAATREVEFPDDKKNASAKDVKDWVGGVDSQEEFDARAHAALKHELNKPSPRTGLVSELRAMLGVQPD